MLYFTQIQVGDLLTDKVEIGGKLFGGNMKVVSMDKADNSVCVKILDYYEHNKPIRITNSDRYSTLQLEYDDIWGERIGSCYVHLRKYEDMVCGYEFSDENKKRLYTA